MDFRPLDAWLERAVGEGRLPGAVALVARGGEVVYGRALGHLDPGKGLPMREDALFRLYSMTKPWVSALALTFVEEGSLSLLDPVEKYLPGFAGVKV
ncbi:serine hydrolase domain-containing protein, partial [Thermus scotoductus]